MAFMGIGLGEQRSKDQAAIMLTGAQETELQQAMNRAKTETERKQIMVEKMIQFATENNASREAGQRKVYMITGVVSVVLVIGLLIVWKKS